jgi:PiT family inorganic phosphate transporter
MGEGLLVLVLVLVVALVFDFINGFHDAANAIATVVSTGVLHDPHGGDHRRPVLNFARRGHGHGGGQDHRGDFTDAALVTQTVVLAALIGAIVWNLITWWYGIPSSSSHALIGGLCGAVVAHAGIDAFQLGRSWWRRCWSRWW